MAWNPETYNQFKSERAAPFNDLLALIQAKPAMDVIDLGCGTGELTRNLADALPNAKVLGIDSSKEMLAKAEALSTANLKFQYQPIQEQLGNRNQWDLVFSNAAIQWLDDHVKLLPQIIAMLKTNGQLAIQVPSQHHNILNKLLNELADQEPYRSTLNNWNRISSVLGTEEYAQLLFENGSKDFTVYEKIYPFVAADTDALYNWIAGTALIPYIERLDLEAKNQFIAAFKKVYEKAYIISIQENNHCCKILESDLYNNNIAP